jgi:hypothetical protein
MIHTKKYLTAAEINEILGDIKFDDTFIPMSQDTYNEAAVVAAISQTGLQHELAMAAVNMSCIGYGNKKYGLFKHKDQIIDIAELLHKANVKTGLGKDAKLKESDITPQRLCRAFRHKTREYIQNTHFETYLYRKYSTHDPTYLSVCFRGAEYLDNLTKDECMYLIAIYARLDMERQTNISERIRRVFQAKGYLSRTVAM